MIQTILTMYIIHIAGMVLYVGKEFYVIQILESFYVEIIIFPVIFGGQTPPVKTHKKIRSLNTYTRYSHFERPILYRSIKLYHKFCNKAI